MAEEGGEIAFFSGDVNEPTAGKGRGVQGAEATCADDQGENERTNRAEDFGAELDGDGVATFYRVEREHEEVGDIGEDVREDDERHGGMNDAWQVLTWVQELADDVVRLDQFRHGKKKFRFRFTYIVPTVKRP